MLTKFYNWLKQKAPVLFDEKMPVWLTILVSVAAAILTYVLAPAYNRQFQVADTKSVHLSKTTDTLNTDIIELSLKIRRLNSALVNSNVSKFELREESLDLVTTLQWRLVDLRVVLQSPNDEKLVTDLSNSLENLRIVLNEPDDERYSTRVNDAMRDLAITTKAVLSRLYDKASLKS